VRILASSALIKAPTGSTAVCPRRRLLRLAFVLLLLLLLVLEEDVSMLLSVASAELLKLRLPLELSFECTLLRIVGRREACAACSAGWVPSNAWKVIGERRAERVVAPDSNLI